MLRFGCWSSPRSASASVIEKFYFPISYPVHFEVNWSPKATTLTNIKKKKCQWYKQNIHKLFSVSLYDQIFCIFACLSLLISLNESPLIFVLLADADLVKYDKHFSMPISVFPGMVLHRLLIVLVLTALGGFLKWTIRWSFVRKSLVSSR